MYVSVIGDFNDWNAESHPLQVRGRSGIWEGFVADVGEGAIYKYHIVSRYHDYRVAKADPYGFSHEVPPQTASIVTDLWYIWGDQTWMEERAKRHVLEAPMAVYEMHLGSWMRVPEEGNRSLTYRELAPKLAAYIQAMGFTHVEFLPIMEHLCTPPGATRPPATAPRHGVMGRRRILCISLTICTSRVSA
jgi:1,4-alpha-glucan branching enzyme